MHYYPKGTAIKTPKTVSPKNVKSASVIFRPGKKFKEMLKGFKFVRKIRLKRVDC